MRQISKRSAWWEKQVFPLCWLAFLLTMSLFVAIGAVQHRTEIGLAWVPLAIVFVYFVLLKVAYSSFVDEVWIDGQDLIVRNLGVEDRIPLSSISRVKGTIFWNPERITLELKSRSDFGSSISFMPPTRFCRYSENPLVRELRELVAIASDEAINASTQTKQSITLESFSVRKW